MINPAITHGNHAGIFGKTAPLNDWKYPRVLENYQIVKTDKGEAIVTKSAPCENEIAAPDWVTFVIGLESFHEKYAHLTQEDEQEAFADLINFEVSPLLHEIFGFGVEAQRDKGMHFHKYGWDIQDGLGLVLAGHNTPRITIQINGSGCAMAARGWQQRLHDYLQDAKGAKLTRIDLCHDDLDGTHCNLDWANEQDSLGGFWCGGKIPNIYHLGGWKRISGKGRTIEVGERESGKFCRIYEKGKKSGDKESPWTRVEVEFKNKSRILPFEMLIKPSQYFIAAYPCLAQLADHITPEKIVTKKKEAKIVWEKSKQILRHQFGKYIAAYKNVYSNDEIIEFIKAPNAKAFPKRLLTVHQSAKYLQNLTENIAHHNAALWEVGMSAA